MPHHGPQRLCIATAVALAAACASGPRWKTWSGQQFPYTKPAARFAQFDIPVVDHPDSSWAASIATHLLYGTTAGETRWVVEDMHVIKASDGSVQGFVVLIGLRPPPGYVQLGGEALVWIGTAGRAHFLVGYQ